jgi:hypothetical protein
MTRPRPPKVTEYLLVEGINDEHVIKNLCFVHGVTAPFIEDVEGIEELFAGIANRIKEEHVKTLGIVIDADMNLAAQWERVKSRLSRMGYSSVPEQASAEGWVSVESSPIRIGVWIMPDNQLPGMLEDFVARLVPSNDLLMEKAEATLQDIEREGLRLYGTTHHPKALIHTWLAWQALPGMPMGRAITIGTLRHDIPIAIAFVRWLRHLFDLLPAAPEVA